MRFLIDESVSIDVANYLRSAGHDVVHIAEIAAGTFDEDVLNRAVEGNRILITNDKDFGELVFRSGQPHHGVLLFRLKNENAPNLVNVLTSLLEQHSNHIAGQFATVREDRLRLHGGIVFLLREHPEQE
jgi:predicted nuclease of predicted toxin-antitoxin system